MDQIDADNPAHEAYIGHFVQALITELEAKGEGTWFFYINQFY